MSNASAAVAAAAARAAGTANEAAASAPSRRVTQLSADGAGVSSFFKYTDNDTSEKTRWGNLPDNPNYWVRIYQLGTGYDVVANSPQDFEFAYSNEWADMSTIASGGLLSGFGGRVARLGKFFGSYTQSRLTNIQVWTGTKPLEFSLPLIFKAHSDPVKEVVEPVRDLVKMATPGGLFAGTEDSSRQQKSMLDHLGMGGAGSTFLRSPGPNLVESVKALLAGHMMPNYAIYMRLGRRVTYPGLVITEIRGKWGNRFTREGWPISAELTVGFRTFTTWTRAEIANSLFSGTQASYGRK